MIPYIGDFAEDATVYHYFNTFDSNDPSASVTVTDLVDADIFVYKDGSITDLVTDGATVVIDFDSRTGVHKITIDTSAHADYATGSDYMVCVVGITVDAATINAALFTFSIENRTTFPKADYPTNFAAMGIESDGDITKVNTLDGHIAQTGDNYARLGAPAGASVSADVAAVKSDSAAILTDTGTTLPNTLGTPAGADMSADIAAIKSDSAAILTDTADMQPKLGTPAADVSADIAAVKAETAAILVDTGTTLDGKIDALNDISVADILTTQMTESYNADGSAPTLAQALHLVLAYLTERSVSGTTVTAKKLDGSTTAATFTLDDDTSPTSITRAS